MRLNNVIKMIIIGAVMSYLNCSVLNGPDDSLTLSKRPYIGNDLRLDGYYYHLNPDGYIDIEFLYENGICLDGSHVSPAGLPQLEEWFANGNYYQTAIQYKIGWGVFQIDSNAIQYEDWVPSDGGPLPVFRNSGVILNDTTFHILESERVNGANKGNVDLVYHFKQFSPKPDSANPYIP